MKQLSVAFLSTVCLFTFDSQAAKVIHCDNCTQSQIESKVKSQPIGNIYYVIDFQLQRVTGFEWMIYESGDWEETSFYPKLTSSRLPDNITSKMTEFFSYRQQFWNALSNNPNAIGQLLNEISSNNYTGSTKLELVDSHFAFNSVTSSDCGKGEATPYDFMTTSSMRKQVFNRMLTSYPDVQSAFNSWNTFA